MPSLRKRLQDCLNIVPTGFEMSLKLISLFQLVPIVVERLEKVRGSCVLVGSPLSAIISDQIEKF